MAAASTPDGRLLMAYLPERQTIGVDMTKLAPGARAEWYDGDPDWVLVISTS